MALTLTIDAARQTYYAVAPSSAGSGGGGGGGAGWQLSIGYCLCRGAGQAALQDVLVGRQEQMLHLAVAAGHPMPTPQDVAALIRQDAQAQFGAAPGAVWIGGQQY